MALFLPPSSTTLPKTSNFSVNPIITNSFPLKKAHLNPKTKHKISPLLYSFSNCTQYSTKAALSSPSLSSISRAQNYHWMVKMEAPPKGFDTKPQIIAYYVQTLQAVLGSEKEAQMCIYNASLDIHFGFCCDIDEETSIELARLPSVLSVRPDSDYNSKEKDYSSSEVQSSPLLTVFTENTHLFPLGNTKHWLVRIAKPEIEIVSKAQIVDHYTEVLSKVMGNHKDAQMCIHHISEQSNLGFCCELDEDSAQELAGVVGVLSVQLDKNFESMDKDYEGDSSDSSATDEMPNIKTKKLFVTGLSFYTSEKTLHEAFEGFGEIVEVKIIMDKISKRSKGYAFVEYTSEEAATAAFKEMNGKIINGWMITVDVAKSNPPKYSRSRPRPPSSHKM